MQIGTHRRVLLPQAITRISIADPAVLDVQVLNARELLVLGRRVGQTNVILWLEDGSVQDRLWSVQRDLTLLNSVLRDIHPDIRAESAPDRDAVVLRGQVPNIRFSGAAEDATRSFLAGGSTGREAAVVVRVPAPTEGADPDAEDAPLSEPAVRSERGRATSSRGTRVLNLIRVGELPARLEERLLSAVRPIGGDEVRVRRIARDDAPDDRVDSFVFEGRVQNQVTLVRVLTTAAHVLRGSAQSADIQTLADEAGSLRTSGAASGGGTVASVVSSAGSRSGGGGGGSSVRSNPARAPALSAAGGRILSFLEVRDLPQVRIEARLYEVNRSRLRDWEPSMNLLLGDFSQGSLLPSPLARLSQGDEAASVGSSGSTVQNVLSLLGGGLANSFQFQSGLVALDLLFSLLENEGIARSLATPSLTVLSGESAELNVGGQIPIDTTIETDTSAASGTLFSSTTFADFGVNLSVAPRVGENDFITMDVAPSISFPNLALTSSISDATGTTQSTTSFESRSLSTSARLLDGHVLVIAGLLQQNTSQDARFTPWLYRIPLLGWLARSEDDQQDDLDLVIVISPNIVRDPLPRVALWEFATTAELLRASFPGPATPEPAIQ
ncbi:MAG: pilus assembly protein N-terminal domain-containing protein [Myxococcota bacterium]